MRVVHWCPNFLAGGGVANSVLALADAQAAIDDIPFREMVRLDYLYVTGWSLLNDIKLVLRTLPALVRARNAY